MANGETDIRCGICHRDIEAAEAGARGWALVGPDPDGHPAYRNDRHAKCGRIQRVARANMQSGRCGCSTCDEGWFSEPSHIYLMNFTLENSRTVVKLGFSRDPESRLHYQLCRDPDMPREIIRTVAMPSGRAALVTEKRMHSELRRMYPDAVVDPAAWSDQIRVGSEIYDAELMPVIMDMLDHAEVAQAA